MRHGERALALRHALSPDEVAALETRLAFSLVASARADEAITLASEAVAHWRAAGDELKEADALTVLANALGSSGRTAAGMEAIARSIDLLESHPPGRELAAAYTRLTSSHMLARDRDTAVSWGERAIALASELGDPILLGRALIETGIADVMDERFEGLVRINQGIELGRQHGLPSLMSHGFSQIGSGCGELRRYDQAVPALIEAAAISGEQSFEANRRYVVAWLARCRFDQGQWNEAEILARDALAGSTSVTYIRFVALNTLGWLRARRGSDDVWPLLDEAFEIADAIGHLQRLWPSAVARAEAGWLEGDLEPHVALLESSFELATQCRHGVAMGELAVWLRRAGRDVALPEGVDGAVRRLGRRRPSHARRPGSVGWDARTRRRARWPTPATRRRSARRWRRSSASVRLPRPSVVAVSCADAACGSRRGGAATPQQTRSSVGPERA